MKEEKMPLLKMWTGETLPLPLPLCCSLHVQVAGVCGFDTYAC